MRTFNCPSSLWAARFLRGGISVPGYASVTANPIHQSRAYSEDHEQTPPLVEEQRQNDQAVHGLPYPPTRHILGNLETRLDTRPQSTRPRMGNIHPKRLTVFLGGQPVQFDHIFLRDACSCSLCVDPSTGQKLFQTTDIPTVVSARTSLMTPEGNLKIEWEHDVPGYPETHLSEFTEDFLQTRSSLRETVRSRYNDQRTVLWDRQTLRADTQWRTYDEYMTSDKILYETLKHLVRYGIVFIKDVPDSEESVEKLGTRIGSLMDTFYGRTWDVRSKPDAKNIAYVW